MGDYSVQIPGQYPPKAWECPVCSKIHSIAHYALTGQVDFRKKPLEPGRVIYGREEGKGSNGCDIGKKYGEPTQTGPQWDADGNQLPLFCPHCGWIDSSMKWIIKVKNYAKDKLGRDIKEQKIAVMTNSVV